MKRSPNIPATPVFDYCRLSDNVSDDLHMRSSDITPADLLISWRDVNTAHANIVGGFI